MKELTIEEFAKLLNEHKIIKCFDDSFSIDSGYTIILDNENEINIVGGSSSGYGGVDIYLNYDHSEDY